MCEYLDEVFPHHPRLIPHLPVERAHVRAWLRYIDEVPSMAIRVPSFQKVLVSRFKMMTEGQIQVLRGREPVASQLLSQNGSERLC